MMNKKHFIYLTDLFLIPLFILSFYTGIELHLAGHVGGHELWHDRSVLHVVSCVFFVLLCCCHIYSHAGWYKGVFVCGVKRKKRMVFFFSLVSVIVFISGFILLFFIEGANSTIGMYHYRFGLFMGVLALLHLINRVPVLKKGLRNTLFAEN